MKEQALNRAKKLEGIVKPLREQGESLKDIASTLTDAGIQTPRGHRWQAAQVKRLLQTLSILHT